MLHDNSAQNRKHFLKNNPSISDHIKSFDGYSKLKSFYPNKLNDTNSYTTYRTNNNGTIKKLFKPKFIKKTEVPNLKMKYSNKKYFNNNIQNNIINTYNQFYTPTSHLTKQSNNNSTERSPNLVEVLKMSKNIIISNKRKKPPLINSNNYILNYTQKSNINTYYSNIDNSKKKKYYNLLPKSCDFIDLNSKNKISYVNLRTNNNIIHNNKSKLKKSYNINKIIFIQSFWRSFHFRKIVIDGIERFYCSLAIYKYLSNIFKKYKKKYFTELFYILNEGKSKNCFNNIYSSKKKCYNIVNNFIKKTPNNNHIINAKTINTEKSLRQKKSTDDIIFNHSNKKCEKTTERYIYKKRLLKNYSNFEIKLSSKKANINIISPFTNFYCTIYNSKKENLLSDAINTIKISNLFKIIRKKYLEIYYPIFIYLLKIFKEICILIKQKEKLIKIIKNLNNKNLSKYYNKYRKNILKLKVKEMFYKEKKTAKKNLSDKIYQKKLTPNKKNNRNNLNRIKVNINLNLLKNKNLITNKRFFILKKIVNNKIYILKNSNLITMQYYFFIWKKKIFHRQLSYTNLNYFKKKINEKGYNNFLRRENSFYNSGNKKYIKLKNRRTYSERKFNDLKSYKSNKKINNYNINKKMKSMLLKPSEFAKYGVCNGKVASLVNKIERKKIMFRYYNEWKKMEGNK